MNLYEQESPILTAKEEIKKAMNPYDPGSPAKPDYFGGRKKQIEIAKERIQGAIQLRQSGGILICGHRGVGKTSLMKKIIDIASKDEAGYPSNNLIIYRRLSRTTNDHELYRLLAEEVVEKVRERKTMFEMIKETAKSVRNVKIFDLEVGMQKDDISRTPFHQWRFCLRSLHNADCVLVALDDADYLSPEALGELKTMIEDFDTIPLIVIVSGGILFEEHLVDDYSPIARVFSGASMNLTRFALEETKEVLENPLAGQRTRWLPDAIAKVNQLTGGYPYLVQCLAKASYKEDTDITPAQVVDSISEAVRIGKSWLDHEIPEASDQDIQSFAKVANANKEVLKSSEISMSGVLPPYIGRLVKLGVLKKISRGRYQIQKSPMIAMYEIMKRGLDSSLQDLSR